MARTRGVEESGDRRAIIELAPIKQVADRAEGNPRHPGCLGGVGRWSLQGRPVGLVEVEAAIADTNEATILRAADAFERQVFRPDPPARPAS